jgi:hypothetical protein
MPALYGGSTIKAANHNRSPTNNINMGVNQPQFDGPSFERLRSLFEYTVGWLATIWFVTYPSILEAKPLGDVKKLRPQYIEFLSVSRADDVLEFALQELAP